MNTVIKQSLSFDCVYTNNSIPIGNVCSSNKSPVCVNVPNHIVCSLLRNSTTSELFLPTGLLAEVRSGCAGRSTWRACWGCTQLPLGPCHPPEEFCLLQHWIDAPHPKKNMHCKLYAYKRRQAFHIAFHQHMYMHRQNGLKGTILPKLKEDIFIYKAKCVM